MFLLAFPSQEDFYYDSVYTHTFKNQTVILFMKQDYNKKMVLVRTLFLLTAKKCVIINNLANFPAIPQLEKERDGIC